MTKRISVSRAARLVGVKRGTLQQKIRTGELKTFEGQIVLSDLLQAYPNAEIEDSSMLERVEQIIEQAPFVSIDSRSLSLDNTALSSKITSLSRDLYHEKQLTQRHELLLDELVQLLRNPSEAPDNRQNLIQWLGSARAKLGDSENDSDEPHAKKSFLRVMTAQATIVSSGHEFFVEGVESILEAGLRGGLALNYGCSNGNCGLCKIRIISGESERIRHHDYSLTEAEKGLGYILSCCYTAVSDIVLDADEASSSADIPTQNIPIRIKKIDRPNDDILIVNAKTPRTRRLRFLAGQRAKLSIDEVGSSTYPIASCPCDDMNLQFHIPINKMDSVARYFDKSAKINDLVTLDGPAGTFVLNENSPHSLIFIAQDSGFATIKGLIEHAMALDSAEQIMLFWITRGKDNHYSNNLCRAWNDALDNFTYVPLYDENNQDLAFIIGQKLGKNDPSTFDYYLSSDAELEAEVNRFIEDQQISSSQYHFDQK